jgi:hypothetical protein
MSALNSQGTRIYHSASLSPSSFSKVENATNIAGPDGTAPLIDVSTLESTRKEYLAGLGDSGQLQIDANFTAATQQMDLKRMFDNTADAEAFALQIPTDSTKTLYHTFQFNAVVTKWSLKASVNNKVDLSITIQTTGGVTYIGTQATLG